MKTDTKFPLKDKIIFPNGWKVEITFGYRKDKSSLGNVDKYYGDLRKSVLYDENGNILSIKIEENPHQFY